MQFAVSISDTHVTLKQSQGHQDYNANAEPKQGYDHTPYERSCFYGVREKAKVNVVVVVLFVCFQTKKHFNYLP